MSLRPHDQIVVLVDGLQKSVHARSFGICGDLRRRVVAVEVEQRVVEVEHEELLAFSSGSEPVDLGLGHELFEGRRVSPTSVPLVG